MNIHAPGGALRRREAILEIVRQQSVHSQEELLSLMGKRGFRVTQPTLSRDVRELGLAKTPSGYVAPDDLGVPAPIPIFASRDRREGPLPPPPPPFGFSPRAGRRLGAIHNPPAS